MNDATAIVRAGSNLGVPMARRNIALIPAAGMQIPLLVPTSSLSVNRTTELPTTWIAIRPKTRGDFVATFAALVDQWRADTQFLSGAAIELHPAYLRIIGMGEKAVPLILTEMSRNGDHWFWALEAITGENPARDSRTVPEATEAWLRWGKVRQLV
ncbi:MAG TPA: hypothetical protein VIO85_00245 [Candidatus Dormibacteraeota bacterium]